MTRLHLCLKKNLKPTLKICLMHLVKSMVFVLMECQQNQTLMLAFTCSYTDSSQLSDTASDKDSQMCAASLTDTTSSIWIWTFLQSLFCVSYRFISHLSRLQSQNEKIESCFSHDKSWNTVPMNHSYIISCLLHNGDGRAITSIYTSLLYTYNFLDRRNSIRKMYTGNGEGKQFLPVKHLSVLFFFFAIKGKNKHLILSKYQAQ